MRNLFTVPVVTKTGINDRSLLCNKSRVTVHDKILIVDNHTVESASYNFSRAGASKNSENVVVMRFMPAIASQYLSHWQSRWEMGTDWQSTY